MPLDIYSTATMLKAVEQMPPVYTFLHDTFCKDMGAIEDDEAIYDYRKGTRRMAPVVHPGTGGVLMARDGYETRKIGFCTIAPERLISMADIDKRAFGENVLGAMTPAERAKRLQAKDLMEMRQAIARRKEWMSMGVLTTGKESVFRYTNEGMDTETTMIADYGFTNFFTPATKWDQAGATIGADLRRIFDLVYDGSGYVDTIVCAPDVAEAIVYDGKILSQYDVRNASMGDINMKYKGQGVRFVGHTSDGVEIYSLSGNYVDDNGLLKPCLDSGKLIAGSKGMLRCYYGPVTQIEDANGTHKTYIKKEVPLFYSSVQSNTSKQRLTSRPTIVPDNIDGWCVASVL